MSTPPTEEDLWTSINLLLASIATAVASGSIESYRLPTGVMVTDAMTVKQMQSLLETYYKLMRSLYPCMAISRGY
jgi:hypothetical protein